MAKQYFHGRLPTFLPCLGIFPPQRRGKPFAASCFLATFAPETKNNGKNNNKIMYNRAGMAHKNSTDMKKTIIGMLIGIMTIIGTTASFGNTDGKRHYNHNHCRQTYACKYHKHDSHRCPSTCSTYCTKTSKHKHKMYKNSNVCKYCKQHVCARYTHQHTANADISKDNP